MAKQGRQIALQNQHTLVVDGAGHGHLALDVHHPFLAGMGARADAHRQAKTVVAGVDLRHAIDLADLAAGKGDQVLAVADRRMQVLLHRVVAQALRGQRGFDIGGLHQTVLP